MVGALITTSSEVRAAVEAAPGLVRSNQVSLTPEEDGTVLIFIDNLDYESSFKAEVCDAKNIHSNI